MSRTIITHKNKVPLNSDGLILSEFNPALAYHWFDFNANGDTIQSGALTVAKNYGQSGMDLYAQAGTPPSPTQSQLITKTFSNGMTWANFAADNSQSNPAAVHLGTASSTSFKDVGTTFIVARDGGRLYAFSSNTTINTTDQKVSTLVRGGTFDYEDTYGIIPSQAPGRMLRTTNLGGLAISVHQYDISLQQPPPPPETNYLQSVFGQVNGMTASEVITGPYDLEINGRNYFQLGHTIGINSMIGEFIHYDYLLTDIEIGWVLNYLKNKWSISF